METLSEDDKIEVSVTFLSEEQGGRSNANPACLRGNRYRPHLVLESPTNREVRPSDDYVGVMFEDGPEVAVSGKECTAIVRVLFEPRAAFQPATTFTIREGAKVVGYGTVKRWVA